MEHAHQRSQESGDQKKREEFLRDAEVIRRQLDRLDQLLNDPEAGDYDSFRDRIQKMAEDLGDIVWGMDPDRRM